MSDKAFPGAVRNLLQWEGGYVNDPDDAGGETNFGISKRSYPNVDIKRLTRDEAIDIYKRDWWDHYQLGGLPDAIGSKMLDVMVNMGAHAATVCLQRALNTDGQPVAVDGVLGPATRAACNVAGPGLLSALRFAVADHYRAIVAANPRDYKFLRGWLRRAAS